ncbi:hypothetical protein [Streptomyces sp. NPDC057781]|uniref:hypothetical protein n=1 Tax=unclassified Streptomyces TaxID=2593676 RepID=UPI0036C48817
MSSSLSADIAVDLRVQPVDEVLDRVERSLQVRLDRETLVRKRRTVGARTDRDTWVRVERRRIDKISSQGWNGFECAATLGGIVKPAWYACVAWGERYGAVMWRADETELLPAEPVKPGGVLTDDPKLPDTWWDTLSSSLDALAAHYTSRVATPDTVTITQTVVTDAIRSVFPGPLDTNIGCWAPAHADMNWANVTGPEFCLFDWEDWGMAPRGLDSASLWGNSLAVPALAERVWHERRRDLESRDGMLMMLFFCTKIVGPYAHPDDPRLEPARRAAARIVENLREAPSGLA